MFFSLLSPKAMANSWGKHTDQKPTEERLSNEMFFGNKDFEQLQQIPRNPGDNVHAQVCAQVFCQIKEFLVDSFFISVF